VSHQAAGCQGSLPNHEENESFGSIQLEGTEEVLEIEEDGDTQPEFILGSAMEEIVEEVNNEQDDEGLEVTEEYLMQIDTDNVVIEVVKHGGRNGQIVATIVES
jgi:hypothetical protein